MSDKIVYQDTEITKAADAFLEHAESHAVELRIPTFLGDKTDWDVQKFHQSWMVRRAFERGVAWQQGRNSHAISTLERIMTMIPLHPPTQICPDMECSVCGVRDCPAHDPFHYHHDGCPSCS